MHQCAQFSSNPCKSQAEAVKQIGGYLIGTKDKGIILHPDTTQSFLVWAGADFVGNWSQETAISNVTTAKSRSEFLITYSGCPISWASRMQTEVALSTTESEYISLSSALQETIPMMNLVQEFKDKFATSTVVSIPTICCMLFEDNSGALKLANTLKMHPHTKHINIKYHHFREFIRRGLVLIQSISTNNQLADIFTKPLPRNLFTKFCDQILLWYPKSL